MGRKQLVITHRQKWSAVGRDRPIWEKGIQRGSLAQTAILGKRWGHDCCLTFCSANTLFCPFGFKAAHCHCWWGSARELFMQDTIKSFHFKLINKLPPKAVWKHSSHTWPCALPEHVRHCLGCFRDIQCCHFLPPIPLHWVAWQCSGCHLCPQNCLVWLLPPFLPATERSSSFSYQCCWVSRSTHCSLLSHPKYLSHPSGNEIGLFRCI